MKGSRKSYNDFIIDKLTNSISNRITGDSFMTEVTLLAKSDLRGLSPKNGWLFNWKREFSEHEKEVYKITIHHNPNVIQGSISLSLKSDHVL
jgi:hypothetical protein